MKPSTELFKLIKSLTKSEKRFFKLSSSLQSGDKNYLKIFDFIEKQSIYNEDELKKAFVNETFIKHLPSEKNHLYKLVLKSLRSFYSEQSISSLLKIEVKNVEVLYNKALYKECEKFIIRAKELSKVHEKFYYWYELLSWEKKIFEETNLARELTFNLNHFLEEEELVIAKLKNLAELNVIYSKLNFIYRSGRFARTEKELVIMAGIENFLSVDDENKVNSKRASSMFFYIKGLYSLINRNYPDCFLFFNKTREILDKNPNIKSDNAQLYVLTIEHLLRCCIYINDFGNANKLISEIRALEAEDGFNNAIISVRLFAVSYSQELRLFHLKGDFYKSVDLIPKIEDLQSYFGEKLNKEQEVELTFNKAYSYFGIGNYKKALFYVNLVLNNNEHNLSENIYSYLLVFNLILHFELENYDVLEYVIKSTKRFLNKQDRANNVETVFIRHVRKLVKSMTNADKKLVLNQLKKDISEVMKNHYEQAFLESFNINAWIESKIQKISFSEAVKNELKSINQF